MLGGNIRFVVSKLTKINCYFQLQTVSVHDSVTESEKRKNTDF